MIAGGRTFKLSFSWVEAWDSGRTPRKSEMDKWGRAIRECFWVSKDPEQRRQDFWRLPLYIQWRRPSSSDSISYDVAQNVDFLTCLYLLGNIRIERRDHMLQKGPQLSGSFRYYSGIFGKGSSTPRCNWDLIKASRSRSIAKFWWYPISMESGKDKNGFKDSFVGTRSRLA